MALSTQPFLEDVQDSAPEGLVGEFKAAGRAHGIPPEVLAGLAWVESGMGTDRGPSSAGAVGLMQFSPPTAGELGIDPDDDREAIWGAARYLDRLGYREDPVRALASYNGGPRNPQFAFARRVMAAAGDLDPGLEGSASDAVDAFLQGEIGRRALVRRLVTLGVSSDSAVVYAQVLSVERRTGPHPGREELAKLYGDLSMDLYEWDP